MMKRQTCAVPPEVAPGVFAIVLPWTRVYVLRAPQESGEYSREEFFLVDSGTRADRAAIESALKLLGLYPQNCRAVLLTHAHPDHAGNAAFFAQCGAQLFIGENEREFLETRCTYIPRLPRALTPLGFLQTVMFALGEVFWPVRRVKAQHILHGSETLSTPCGNWRVLETPGHTRGHIAFFRIDDGTLLSGDALLNVVPFVQRIDLAVPPAIFNENTAQARDSARLLCALPVRVLLSGHGPAMRENTAARLQTFAAKLPM